MLMKTGIFYFTTCFHGFGILRHVDSFVRMLHNNDVLSTISNCLSQYNVEHCVIAGDFNTDLSRANSGNTISLKAFVNEEIFFSLDKFSNRIPYTFNGTRNNHSLIDHFIVSQNLVEKLSDSFIAPLIDNLSDHTPLYCTLSNICTLPLSMY